MDELKSAPRVRGPRAPAHRGLTSSRRRRAASAEALRGSAPLPPAEAAYDDRARPRSVRHILAVMTMLGFVLGAQLTARPAANAARPAAASITVASGKGGIALRTSSRQGLAALAGPDAKPFVPPSGAVPSLPSGGADAAATPRPAAPSGPAQARPSSYRARAPPGLPPPSSDG
ncbi:hypothetical protein [Sphingosinicella sp. BN140058]|uniref:hypothetical protein n=1 Tax=Sphingosinicella sp. BN140058 TaxID=1892855 RepID=UPI001010AFD3|nr:hypothetical protein [Sphingosinicella sp. BN140058]QAY76184.1 hypothetical protein ETR14_06310 [Sphingosinicella sp. BN140058]